jgi:ribosomal protein L11 methyltransferase
MPWHRVDLVVEGASAEALAAALESAGAMSTEISDAGAGTPAEQPAYAEPGAAPALWPRARIRALFEQSVDAGRTVEAALYESGIEAIGAVSVDRVEDEDWVALTQRQFAARRIGRRLWIVPSWQEIPDPAAVNLVLDPGAAFGTGSHPSTRLCLEWLEATIAGGERVLDYGCGSGILAIAALKLGAAAAVAVDVDPLALETARYNARRNAVDLQVVDAQRKLRADATITIANILANPLRMLAPIIASQTRIAGRIALAGILEEQAREVAEAYDPWARLEVSAREEDWVLLAGLRTR